MLDHISFALADSYDNIPKVGDVAGGLPNEHAFPYFFCNRKDFSLAMVARSAVVQQDYDGQEIDGSQAVAFAFEHPGHEEDQVVPAEEWFAWVDFGASCVWCGDCLLSSVIFWGGWLDHGSMSC